MSASILSMSFLAAVTSFCAAGSASSATRSALRTAVSLIKEDKEANWKDPLLVVIVRSSGFDWADAPVASADITTESEQVMRAATSGAVVVRMQRFYTALCPFR